MDFVAIDFETANGKRTSACSLGIAVVQNSQVIETKSWLIRPEPFEINYFNLIIHGLGEEILHDKPSFCDCWDEMIPYLENQTLVAHNAAFDISVLTSTLDHYHIPLPDFNYICSYQASRKVFDKVINYRLDTLAHSLGLQFNHHDALEDARVAAEIFLHMIKKMECETVDEFAEAIDLRLGKVSRFNNFSCKYIKNSPKVQSYSASLPLSKRIIPSTNEFDEDNEFYGKTIVFTGALSSMSRSRAYQVIADLGGCPADNVTKKTDYLVTGIQDFSLLNGHKISSKHRKALKYIKEGQDLHKMIGGEK